MPVGGFLKNHFRHKHLCTRFFHCNFRISSTCASWI